VIGRLAVQQFADVDTEADEILERIAKIQKSIGNGVDGRAITIWSDGRPSAR